MYLVSERHAESDTVILPKSGRAQDVMMGVPSMIDEKELKVIGVKTLE